MTMLTVPSRAGGFKRAAQARPVRAVSAADHLCSAAYLSLFDERASLSTFLFHGLFKDRAEAGAGDADPQQGVTVDDFRWFVEYFLSHGYRFVAVADVLAGLPPAGKYALLTFDDGYANNARALPVPRECHVPAACFVSSGHVERGRCFWWDVLYREARSRGAAPWEITIEVRRLKRLPFDRIDVELAARFGAAAFAPRGDADRPFTPAELKAFAADLLITLGNHTADHAILTRCDAAEVHEQLSRCQSALRQMAGVTPQCVAYPNGDYSNAVVSACRDVGLRLGIGVEPRKNRLPVNLSAEDAFRLGRFTPAGGAALRAQCRVFRSDLRLYDTVRSFLK